MSDCWFTRFSKGFSMSVFKFADILNAYDSWTLNICLNPSNIYKTNFVFVSHLNSNFYFNNFVIFACIF